MKIVKFAEARLGCDFVCLTLFVAESPGVGGALRRPHFSTLRLR